MWDDSLIFVAMYKNHHTDICKQAMWSNGGGGGGGWWRAICNMLCIHGGSYTIRTGSDLGEQNIIGIILFSFSFT